MTYVRSLMSYVRSRSRDDWDRAQEIADGDVDRARVLHNALWEAYRIIATLSYDCTEWPVDGHDKRSTLETLAELMGPKDVSAATYEEWVGRAYDLIRTGSLQ